MQLHQLIQDVGAESGAANCREFWRRRHGRRIELTDEADRLRFFDESNVTTIRGVALPLVGPML